MFSGTCLPEELGVDQFSPVQNIYPNPVQEVLHIVLHQKPQAVKVFSATGVCLFTAEPDSKDVEVDVSGFTPGVYLVYLLLANGEEVVRQVVVN